MITFDLRLDQFRVVDHRPDRAVQVMNDHVIQVVPRSLGAGEPLVGFPKQLMVFPLPLANDFLAFDEPLAFKAGCHAGFQKLMRKRFPQIIYSSHLDGSGGGFCFVASGNNDNLHVPMAGGFLDPAEYFESIHSGHHHIEQYQIVICFFH